MSARSKRFSGKRSLTELVKYCEKYFDGVNSQSIEGKGAWNARIIKEVSIAMEWLDKCSTKGGGEEDYVKLRRIAQEYAGHYIAKECILIAAFILGYDFTYAPRTDIFYINVELEEAA